MFSFCGFLCGGLCIRRTVGSYIVAISHRGLFRRLHFSGSCWRIPGVHHHQFEWLGDVLPTNVNGRCLNCFPASAAPAQAPEAPEDESSDSSASSSEEEAAGE